MRQRVRRHLRRHPSLSDEDKVHEATRTMTRIGEEPADSICYVQLSDEDSQVMPPDGGFKKGHCSIVNIEPADVNDEVECVTTIYHEGLHTDDIHQHGTDGISREREIVAHEKTVKFLRRWAKKENERTVWCSQHKTNEGIHQRINEVIVEEHRSIQVLSTEEN